MFIMAEIKAIFFDLDNTLIDFKKMKESSCMAAAQAMADAGLEMDVDEAYAKLMEVYLDIGIESDEAFTKFLESVGQFDHKILAAAINAYLKEKDGFIKSYDNVDAVLDGLKKKGIMLAVVTDAPKTKAFQRLYAMEITNYFEFVVGFEDTGEFKDSGLPLKLALEKITEIVPGIRSEEIMMVGDSLTRDVESAQKIGFVAVHAKYGHAWEEESDAKPDHSLDDISDILKIV